jgi:MFS family permease
MAGPALGGFVVGAGGWRLLFVLTAIAMIVIAISAQRVLRRRAQRPDSAAPPFDIGGAVLFSSLLVTGLLTLTLGPGAGWLAPPTLGGIVLFAVLLGGFLRAERSHPAPMLDFALFRNGAFAFGALGAVVVFMGISATRFLAPFFLQAVRGLNPSQIGLLLLPAAVVTAVTAPFVGRFADRFGVRLFANIGFGVAVLGLVVFTRLDNDTPTWVVVAGLVILALGMSSFSAPNSASILNSVDPGSHGVAAGFVNLCRNTGNVLGIAFGTAIVTMTMARAGFPPSLAAVDPAAGVGVFAAFTRGVQIASLALITLALPVLAILVISTRRARVQM